MPLGMGIKKDSRMACDVCGERRDCGLEAGLSFPTVLLITYVLA